MKQAWYLGYGADDVGDRALLVGDPDRVDRIASLLTDVTRLPVKRGLKSITGTYADRRVTIAAFGMGAPIATVVAHELADLGVRHLLRIGTAMYFPDAMAGDLIAANAAVSFEGTSKSYSDTENLVVKPRLLDALREAGAGGDTPVKEGAFATFDAFYREMFALPGDAEAERRVAQNRRMLAKRGAIAADMETSALVSAGKALGVTCGSLCLGTVNGLTLDKIDADAMASGEARLFRIGLEALAVC